MQEIVICLSLMTVSALILLWLSWKRENKNKRDMMKVLFLTGFIGLAVCIRDSNRQQALLTGHLPRGEAGESDRNEDLVLHVPDLLENYDYRVRVEAKHLEGKELEQLFEDAREEAELSFLGENTSFDMISSAVTLPEYLQEQQVEAAWSFEPAGIIRTDGQLETEGIGPEGELVMASLTLHYEEEYRNFSFACRVYPVLLSKPEQLLADLQEYFNRQNGMAKDYLQLPFTLDGYEMQWFIQKDNTWLFIIILGIAAAVAVYAKDELQAQKQEQQRREELLRQYPDMVSKLSLLLGAGMTLSGAWERIVKNYQRQLAQKRVEPVEVYEQMLISYRELQDGMGELKVYERFGERCGTPQYRKLSTLIVQNLRKGSASMTKLLEKEVAEAFTMRKSHAKKAGEEAGTKLLLPMMLMLCIVLVIILVPAILSFQM